MPSARRGGHPRRGLTIRTSSSAPTLFDKSRCCRKQQSVGVVSSGVMRPKMNTMAHETERGCAAMSPNAPLRGASAGGDFGAGVLPVEWRDPGGQMARAPVAWGSHSRRGPIAVASSSVSPREEPGGCSRSRITVAGALGFCGHRHDVVADGGDCQRRYPALHSRRWPTRRGRIRPMVLRIIRSFSAIARFKHRSRWKT